MPDTYIQDVKKVVDDLSRDEGLMLEEKLIRLQLVAGYVDTAMNRLEDELATEKGYVQ
jgi:hypothetical protein